MNDAIENELRELNLRKTIEELEKAVILESAVEVVLDLTPRNCTSTGHSVPFTERALEFVGS